MEVISDTRITYLTDLVRELRNVRLVALNLRRSQEWIWRFWAGF